MGTVLRKLIWLLFVAAIGYGVYYASVKWWEGPLTWNNAKQQAARAYEATKEKVTGMTADTAKQKASEYADQVAEEAKGGVVKYAKQKAGEALAGIGEKIISTAGTITSGSAFSGPSVPPPAGPGFRVPSPPSALSVTVGTELVLSIAPGGTYEIQWGDTAVDRGIAGGGEVRLVRHAWKKPGDYAVNVSVTMPGAATSSVAFPVRVFAD